MGQSCGLICLFPFKFAGLWLQHAWKLFLPHIVAEEDSQKTPDTKVNRNVKGYRDGMPKSIEKR